MVCLNTISLPDPGPRPHMLDTLSDSHGVSPRAARMFGRFYDQHQVLISDLPHREMLAQTLAKLVQDNPEITSMQGIAAYTKTQTHNTPADSDWLRSIFDAAGLQRWEALTLSMTNCASALVAIHALLNHDQPFLVLAGEKAFHSSGNRLAVGLLGEAPAAALFLPGAGRRVRSTHVQHLPRFFLNPDDMSEEDRQALPSAFENGFTRFLADCVASDPDFFDRAPVLVPYNLNVPMVMRVLGQLGLTHLVQAGHSGRSGHSFCSDTLVNLARHPVPLNAPVFMFCAGMGVTYAAVLLEPATSAPLTQP